MLLHILAIGGLKEQESISKMLVSANVGGYDDLHSARCEAGAVDQWQRSPVVGLRCHTMGTSITELETGVSGQG